MNRPVETDYFIRSRERMIYCRVRFDAEDFGVRGEQDCRILLTGEGPPGFAYEFDTRFVMRHTAFVEGFIDVGEIAGGLYVISLVIDGDEVVTDHTLDTRDVLRLDRMYPGIVISVHIPKTAGNSFATLLSKYFGDSLFQHEYDRSVRMSRKVRERRSNGAGRSVTRSRETAPPGRGYCIHGHFPVKSYRKRFPELLKEARLVTFFRDPVERVISHYEYIRKNIDSLKRAMTPVKQAVGIDGISLHDFAQMDIARNRQYAFTEPFSPEDFFSIGIVEDFDRSLALMKRTMGIQEDLPHRNILVNPAKSSYDEELRSHIRKHNEQDVELYRRAREYFEGLCRRYLQGG